MSTVMSMYTHVWTTCTELHFRDGRDMLWTGFKAAGLRPTNLKQKKKKKDICTSRNRMEPRQTTGRAEGSGTVLAGGGDDEVIEESM